MRIMGKRGMVPFWKLRAFDYVCSPSCYTVRKETGGLGESRVSLSVAGLLGSAF